VIIKNCVKVKLIPHEVVIKEIINQLLMNKEIKVIKCLLFVLLFIILIMKLNTYDTKTESIDVEKTHCQIECI
jgi:hypothetical protein